MPRKRQCSEYSEDNPHCTRWLVGQSNRITCGPACRNRRARRVKAQKDRANRLRSDKNTPPEEIQAMQAAAAKKRADVGHQLLVEEMRPVVRESITDDVLKSIQKLVGLTPRAVELIERDMESADPNVAQKAYTLLMRYSVGHASVAPAPTTPAQGGMNVTFLMPRPGDPDGPAPPPAHAVELKTCVECKLEKPEPEFVGASPRCQTCHDELLAIVAEKFGPE